MTKKIKQMNTFDKITQQIKKENIEPIPKWYFILKNISVWFVFLLSIVIGAIAFSVILFSMQQTEFELFAHFKDSFLEKILVFLPFFWIVVLLIFTVFSYFSLRNSKKSYKNSLLSLLGLSTFISILLGTLFFIGGGAKKLEQSFANNIEAYNSLQEKRIKIWMNPKEGMLAGTIEKTATDTIFLKDFSDKNWKIVYKDVFISQKIELIKGEKIKLIGTQINDNLFITKEMRPWNGRGNKQNKKK